jgi:heptosyltransferase III
VSAAGLKVCRWGQRPLETNMKRILVIRGGAIGDFILTLPALKALRDAYPHAHIEILGYKHIAALAENRFYAQAVRSIEYGSLSSFFAKNAELRSELVTYFAGFDLLISYLYDPDGILESNLRRCGVELLICGPAKIDKGNHAARQLARPMQELGLAVENLAAKVYPSSEDRQRAQELLRDFPRPLAVFHPGSGSKKKNWPLENWIKIGNGLLGLDHFQGSLVIVSGEADEDQVRSLRAIWKDERVQFAKNLPLPGLAAVFENAIFVGHDSGISQLAAAAGANCILLFGPSDPEVWAPKNEKVQIIQAPTGDMASLGFEAVRDALINRLEACLPEKQIRS